MSFTGGKHEKKRFIKSDRSSAGCDDADSNDSMR
jgi:hypothetical protein